MTATDLHKAATAEILADLESEDHQAVIVNSPPGAGKSTLVVDTAASLSEVSAVPIICQTNAQADDLINKILTTTDLVAGRLHGGTTPDLTPGDRLLIGRSVNDVAAADIVVSPAAKWAYVSNTSYPLAIIDEAYQMRSDQLFYLGGLFDRLLMVGDPGQLDPFTPVDDSRWRGQIDGPVSPAVATVLHHHPTSPVHRLPVSWRLPAACAPLVSDAFYPQLPFSAGSSNTDRGLAADPGSGSREDVAIDVAIDNGWAFLELEPRTIPATDEEALLATANVVVRLLQRNVHATDAGDESGVVGADRIAIGVVHRVQRSAAQILLEEIAADVGVDASQVTVETANKLQGQEFHVVVVLHPLSGRAAASEFHLETGRLCVLMSRHRHACIIVGRAGITELLDDHPLSTPIWLGAPIPVPDGWEANQTVIAGLEPFTVPYL